MFSTTPKIFMIDDDPIFSQLVEKRLGQMGVTDIQVFGSAESGLAALKDRPDFVVLDFNLPGLNGLDTLKKIKKQGPDTQIVVLTTLGDEKLSKECLENGASAFLSKDNDDSVNQIFSRIKGISHRKTMRFRFRIIFAIIIMMALYLVWINLF